MQPSDDKSEQLQFIEWYLLHKQRESKFKYSFSFLTGLLCEIEARCTQWNSYWIHEKLRQWMECIEHLNKIKVEIKEFVRKLFNKELKEDSYEELLEVKKQIAQWLADDLRLINQVHMTRIGSQVILHDHVLTGEERDKAKYRIYINHVYLSQICTYFAKMIDLEEHILSLSLLTDTKSSKKDMFLIISQEWWEP